jgi:hypothetical protein
MGVYEGAKEILAFSDDPYITLDRFVTCFYQRKCYRAVCIYLILMKKNSSSPEKTMLTLTVGFLALFGYTLNDLFFWTALIMGCIGVFVPFLARWLDRLWMRFSNILGMIFPKITLTLLFFFILYPTAILSTIFSKKRPLLLKNPRRSTFIEVNKSFNANFFEKPW